jgi:hypothetical protein
VDLGKVPAGTRLRFEVIGPTGVNNGSPWSDWDNVL